PVPLGRFWRRVRSGAALTAIGDTVYLLKGGGSFEFWRYCRQGDEQPFPRPPRSGVGDESYTSCALLPLATVGRIVRLRPSGQGRIILLDASGRCVVDGNSPVRLVLRPGVYFLVIRGDSGSILRKMVVIR
ncbi:MAG: T9SS type A sorting domain-containing protein, partial [candidate division WOR-3 bacterium]